MATSDLNSVILIGRLTRDAELNYSPNGSAIVSISVAVNRSRKEGDQWISEANFFDVSYFGKGAEAVKQYLTKGKQVAVQGSLKQDRWEKDGQKFSKIRIVANSVELLGGRSDNGGNGYNGTAPSGGYQANSGYTQRTSMPAQSYDQGPEETFGGESTDFPEDIPF